MSVSKYPVPLTAELVDADPILLLMLLLLLILLTPDEVEANPMPLLPELTPLLPVVAVVSSVV